MRAYPAPWGRDSVYFALLNRGKKSVALDLKRPGRPRRARRLLLARADIIVEQFRPGVMERLGLGPADVAAINPKAIYCSITGYGQTGPARDVAGHDLNYIGDAGLLALVDRAARSAGGAAGADRRHRRRRLSRRDEHPAGACANATGPGAGAALDIAMTDNLFPFLFWALGDGLAGGALARQRRAYADGRQRALSPLSLRRCAHSRRRCARGEILGDFLRHHRAGGCVSRRSPSRPRRSPASAPSSKASPRRVWRARFAGRDCCCSIVATLREALDNPQFAARGLMAHRLVNEAGASLPALPAPVDAGFPRRRRARLVPAPLLGAHNREFGVDALAERPSAAKGNS